MNTPTKIVAGALVVALAGALVIELRRVKELEASLAAARIENAASSKQISTIKQQIAELRDRSAAPSAAPASAVQTGAAVAQEPPAPVPGVTPKAPKGWFKNGSSNGPYEVGVDENNSWGGMPSAYAKSTGPADGKFGGMMQTISAEQFKNQRVRLTGWVKTEEANDGGGHLWLRVDGQEVGRSLQFDNMEGRAPKGTTDWQEYSVVLDVPAESTRLNYGFFVSGKGKMWVNGLMITPVDSSVPSTNLIKPAPALPSAPVNLGFGPTPN